MFSMEPLPSPGNNQELGRVGQQLAGLVGPVNMAKARLEMLFDKKLNATGWGHWQTPNFEVADRYNLQSPFDVSFTASDHRGTTSRVVSVKHNGNEAYFYFPNNFDWIKLTEAEMNTATDDNTKREFAELIEGMKAIQGRESMRQSLIQVTASPVWNTPDGPEIPRDFRLTYQLTTGDEVRPILAEDTEEPRAGTLEELSRMAEAIRLSAREAMVGKVELVKDNAPDSPMVVPHRIPFEV